MPNQVVKKAMNDLDVCRRKYAGQEFRATEQDGEKHLAGHPAVFNSEADIGGWFKEIIEPGAFDGCDLTDVPFFVNHRTNKIPLARSRNNNGNSTMKLSIDLTGLAMDARVDTENNQEARAVYSAVERGDMTGMSFSFRVSEQSWEDLETDYPIRRIKKIAKVYEVSAVNDPAYEDTDISARDKEALESARAALESARSKELESSKEAEVYKLRNEILSK